MLLLKPTVEKDDSSYPILQDSANSVCVIDGAGTLFRMRFHIQELSRPRASDLEFVLLGS